MKPYRIFTVNPGSTSTKIALFDGDEERFSVSIDHDAEKLAQYPSISDQMPYRMETIRAALAARGITLSGVDACVGRGGGLLPLAGGTYRVDALLLDHAIRGANGISHPAQLGVQLARAFAAELGCPAFTVNPPDVDEYEPVARITGIRGVYRQSHLHSLNLKETAIRHSKRMGVRYEDCRYIVCHIGGGISVSAHCCGRMIDGNDIAKGEGPMAPTRCGSVPTADIIELCRTGDPDELRLLCTKTGGLVDHLGTSDAREVRRRIESGDQRAKLVWEAMLYQIVKYIGAMAAVLHGRVDAILLGGGLVHSEELVQYITDCCGFLAPVYAYPGEFEMEAMAQGAIRVLSGAEEARTYTGQAPLPPL